MEIRKLTIVIPFYNEAKYLEEIVDRVIKTDLVNGIKKEIILVNDSSTDNSPDLAKDLCRNE
ncbi:MAG: glycosyltransferase, partial [Saprospiraceae bacterium]|nr:glycosyltransferase [Saprospiraceae bacterium]